MTLAIAVDVLKSESRKFRMIFSVVSKEDGINLSTIAPFGIRPEVGTPISTAPPAASTATPVTVKGPCARAYTSPSIPRNSVSIRFPPRRLSAEPTVETFTSIRCPGLANGGTSAVTNTAARLSVCSGCCACCSANLTMFSPRSNSDTGPSTLTPSPDKSEVRLCPVTLRSLPSPVPESPPTSPYPIS